MCYYEASEKEYEYVSYRILPSIMELRHAKAFRPLNPTAVRWDPNLHQDGQSAPIWLSELLKKTLQGLEPWIFGFEDQRRIHWAIAPIRESIETAKSVVIWGVLASLYNAINAPLQTVACQKRLDGQKIEVYNDLRLNNRRRKLLNLLVFLENAFCVNVILTQQRDIFLSSLPVLHAPQLIA